MSNSASEAVPAATGALLAETAPPFTAIAVMTDSAMFHQIIRFAPKETWLIIGWAGWLGLRISSALVLSYYFVRLPESHQTIHPGKAAYWRTSGSSIEWRNYLSVIGFVLSDSNIFMILDFFY